MQIEKWIRVALPAVAGLTLITMGTMSLYSSNSSSETAVVKEAKSVLRHVVLFKFKDESSETDVKKVVDAFAKLKESIPQIADFEYGTNNSPEGLNNGLTHCFLVTFTSEEDRDVYLPHPKHKEFVELLKPHLDSATVVDYWSQR